jgi:hypothetical protein
MTDPFVNRELWWLEESGSLLDDARDPAAPPLARLRCAGRHQREPGRVLHGPDPAAQAPGSRSQPGGPAGPRAGRCAAALLRRPARAAGPGRHRAAAAGGSHPPATVLAAGAVPRHHPSSPDAARGGPRASLAVPRQPGAGAAGLDSPRGGLGPPPQRAVHRPHPGAGAATVHLRDRRAPPARVQRSPVWRSFMRRWRGPDGRRPRRILGARRSRESGSWRPSPTRRCRLSPGIGSCSIRGPPGPRHATLPACARGRTPGRGRAPM